MPEMRLETITTEKAADWLSKNKNNRPMRQRHIDRLALAISNGEYEVNGETIKFNCDGSLIDGQHRLAAVIRAGRPIKSYVVRGVDGYDTIDQGHPRTLGDILSREGKKHYTTLASAALWLSSLDDKVEYHAVLRKTNATMHSMIANRPDLEESVGYIRDLLNRAREFRAPGGVLAACHCVFSKKDRSLSDDFFSKFLVGEELTRTMPEYKLRQVFLSNASSIRKLSSYHLCCLTIKAWNAKRNGKEMKQLKMSSEESRPEII